jgi:TRAP-type C4-dicarboxylate transport system permease small subunit
MLKFLKNLDDYLAMIAMAFIILLACANVFMRYVIGNPWGWVEEVTIFTFVWLTMLGAASVVKAEGHCSIDVLARKLPPGPKRVLDMFVHLCTMATLALLIWYGLDLALSAGGKTTPMLGIPYTYVDIAVPLGSAFMMMHYAKLFWLDLTGKSQQEDTNCKIEE